MPDITIPESLVQVVAERILHGENSGHMPTTIARAALRAAAPHIAAQALEDFADAHRMPWTMFLRDDGSPVTVGDLMREVAAHYRIEAGNG